jgi:phosphate transport system substrate-binding protein
LLIGARLMLGLFLLWPLAVEPALASKRVALVIGNSAYVHAPELANPRNDATDMAAALRALGFTVVDGVDLDKPALDRKLREFSGALAGADTGVFFYAGHGLQVGGNNYIVPVDAQLSTAAALEFEMVRLDQIQRIMESEAKTNILFLDACRNNPLARNLARSMGTRSAAIGRGLAAAESGVGTLISFSTQPGNVALDGAGRNSPFTGPLVKYLTSSTEDALTILTSVRNDVLAATNDAQVPWENHALRAKFYFQEPKAGLPGLPGPPRPKTMPFSTAEIVGAGATFPAAAYIKWADAYKTETGIGVAYQSNGSGAGVKQIMARTVTFAGTDVAISDGELREAGLVQWPMVLGGVVPIVNLEGVGQDSLILDGPTLAKIYLGEIKTWDDPAIRALNPSANLPSQPIAVVYRSDGSGTTFTFTSYLSSVSDPWVTKFGPRTAVEWPVGVGAKGNVGIADAVARTKGAIGYVEYGYVKLAKLSSVKLVNRFGKAVGASTASMQAAIAASLTRNASPNPIHQAGPNVWPITSATYILMYRQPRDVAASNSALRFFAWALDKGGTMAEQLDYVPLPPEAIKQVKAIWASDINRYE